MTFLKSFFVFIPSVRFPKNQQSFIKSCLVLLLAALSLKNASLPYENKNSFQEVVKTQSIGIDEYQEDLRTKALKEYLLKHNSPLEDKAVVFVWAADLYDIKPWPLMAAIAGKESSFGKAIPANSYNPFGWGLTGNQVIRFDSWEEAILTVAEGLKTDYIGRGLKTVAQIESRYTPISANSHKSWQRGVRQFIDEIQDEFNGDLLAGYDA